MNKRKQASTQKTDPAPEQCRVRHQLRPESAAALLMRQPNSLRGLVQSQRDALAVSAVDDENGHLVVSRFGDALWNLSSVWTVKSARAHERRIVWPDDLPKELVDDLKAVAYTWLRRGRPNIGPVAPITVRLHTQNCMPLLRHLVAAGVKRLEDVEPLLVADFIAAYRKRVVPSHLSSALELLEGAWLFREELIYPLRKDPFNGKTLDSIAGVDPRLVNQAANLTPVIPPSVNGLLFDHALQAAAYFPRLLDMRDCGELVPAARKLLHFRDAALYLVQITTGMRNSEALGVSSNSWRKEEKAGVAFHWIRTVDVKTRAGPVDYLMPAELVPVLELLQLYAEPLQEELKREVAAINRTLEGQSSSSLENGWLTKVGRATGIQRRDDALSYANLLFLSQAGRHRSITGGCRIEVMNNRASQEAMLRLARSAGTDWPLNNMQCRRTFAWEASHSSLGVYGPIFVKWQFHHKNLSLSYLYGANPRQDAELYGELYAEFTDAKVEVMERWFLPHEPLSGGAGRRLMKTRATPHKDLDKLLLATAQTITIRSTGHSWCTAEGACAGGGPYDSHLCTDCSRGVIDSSFAATWQRLHLSNLRIASHTSSGPGAQAHVTRSLAASRKTLSDLGIPEVSPPDHSGCV